MEPSFKDMTDEQRTACAALLGTLIGRMMQLDVMLAGEDHALAVTLARAELTGTVQAMTAELFDSYPPVS